MLSRLVLGFWSAWFAIVTVTNVTDGLKGAGILSGEWKFASGNFELLVKTIAIYGLPRAAATMMFIGVIAWEALAAVLYCRAARDANGTPTSQASAQLAAIVGVALFAAFVLADELFIAFPTGMEATHLRIMAAQLISWLVVHVDQRRAQ